jgi:pyruvate ferredoxin oxidoreductase gamma subunit
MAENITIKWYGKAGRGLMEAASTLARVLSLEGKHVQAFPEFNLNRCLAPASAYNRISASPIRLHSVVENADVEVLLEPALLKFIDIRPDSKKNTVFIMNTSLAPEYIKEKLNLKTNKIMTLDVEPVPPHIPLLAIVINHLKLMPIENFKERLKEILPGNINSERMIENMKIIDQALKEVQEI